MAGLVAGGGLCNTCLHRVLKGAGRRTGEDVKRQAKSKDISVCEEDSWQGGKRERLTNHAGERKD